MSQNLLLIKYDSSVVNKPQDRFYEFKRKSGASFFLEGTSPADAWKRNGRSRSEIKEIDTVSEYRL